MTEQGRTPGKFDYEQYFTVDPGTSTIGFTDAGRRAAGNRENDPRARGKLLTGMAIRAAMAALPKGSELERSNWARDAVMGLADEAQPPLKPASELGAFIAGVTDVLFPQAPEAPGGTEQ